MPLTKKLSKINFSLQYDTITIYFEKLQESYSKNLLAFLSGCDSLEFTKEQEVSDTQIGCYQRDVDKAGQYDRNVYRNDADHGLYHQDEFNLENTHSHVKCKSMLDHEKLEIMLNIAIEHELMSKEEAAEILIDFDRRYKTNIQAIAAFLTESKDQEKSSKAIHAFIKQCMDLDTLVFLHQELLSPQYVYLRKMSSSSGALFWKAVVSQDGTVGTSSNIWALIEQAFELQMIHIFDTTCHLNRQIGYERAIELRKDNRFFGMQRLCTAETKPTDENYIIKLLKDGHAEKLEVQYAAHFKQYS